MLIWAGTDQLMKTREISRVVDKKLRVNHIMYGKSTLIDLIIMSKDMLFNNYWSYIASGSSNQSETTFMKLESIAHDAIESMRGSTGSVFLDEIEIKNSVGEGFSHSSNGFSYNLFNGARTETLNSNVDKKRGELHSAYCLAN